ncbi:unnamed protein product, partial [Ectocarpus sp. 8 AP-2014]
RTSPVRFAFRERSQEDSQAYIPGPHCFNNVPQEPLFFSGVARGGEGGGIYFYFLVKFTFLRYPGTTKLSTWLNCKYVDWNPHRRLLL